MIDINALDKATVEGMRRFDALEPSSVLKTTPPAELTSALIARELDLDEERADFLLGMIRDENSGDVVFVS